MAPWLHDEKVEAWEDPADRKPRPTERTVPYPQQVACRHSWEDAKRRRLERDGFAILEQVKGPGTHYLPPPEFATLTELLYTEQPRELKRALRSGVLDWGKTVVICRDAATEEPEVA